MDNPFKSLKKEEEEAKEPVLPVIPAENPVDPSLAPPVVNDELPKVEEEVKSVEAPVEVKREKSMKQQILDEYGGLESNVPVNSAYWKS